MSVEASCGLEYWKFGLSIVGYLGAAAAFIVGLLQYRRADYWRRSEFLATEMKEFFDDPGVTATLTMIDWGVRRVKLNVPAADPRGVLIDRGLQCAALRPHTMLTVGSDQVEGVADGVGSSNSVLSGGASFTPEQAAIRDAYDRFLDGLDRFGNYLEGDLLSIDDLRPYLDYWVNSIADTNCTTEDSLWSLCLLAYINFYSFLGVRRLFDDYGHDISLDKPLVAKFLHQASDPALAHAVLAHARAGQRMHPAAHPADAS